ncbi:MAG: hypothetical protein KIY12_10300, partial [Thermoplasmata archaeon]|nr:hypothetical protein [Candidatus Sysuiplasma superficiale]
AVREFNPGDEVLLTSESGMVIRIPVEDIRVMGRNTQGVRIMKLEEGDRVTAMTRLVGSEVEERVMEEGQREEELKRNQQPAQKQPDLKVDESKIIEPKERETDE